MENNLNKICLISAITLLQSVPLFATNYVFTSSKNTGHDFHNLSNWAPTPGSTTSWSATDNAIVTNSGSSALTTLFNTSGSNAATLTINSTGNLEQTANTLTTSDLIINNGGVLNANGGTITLNKQMSNDGMIFAADNGTLNLNNISTNGGIENKSGVLQAYGTVTNNGEIFNDNEMNIQSGQNFYNDATFKNLSNTTNTNHGHISVEGRFWNRDGGQVLIDSGTTMTIGATGSVSNYGGGISWENSGTMTFLGGSNVVHTSAGIFKNYGVFDLQSGTFEQRLDTGKNFINESTGQISIGSAGDSANFYVQEGAILENYGQITVLSGSFLHSTEQNRPGSNSPDSNIYNYGTITVNNDGYVNIYTRFTNESNGVVNNNGLWSQGSETFFGMANNSLFNNTGRFNNNTNIYLSDVLFHNNGGEIYQFRDEMEIGDFTNNGEINIKNSGTGTAIVKSGKLFDNAGTFTVGTSWSMENNSTTLNSGTWTQELGSTFNNNGGVFNNAGTFHNNINFNLFQNNINNDNGLFIQENNNLVLNGYTNPSAGSIEIGSNASANLDTGQSFSNLGQFTNYGSILNESSMFANNSQFINYGDITNDGTIENHSGGVWTQEIGSSFVNNSIFINQGTFNSYINMNLDSSHFGNFVGAILNQEANRLTIGNYEGRGSITINENASAIINSATFNGFRIFENYAAGNSLFDPGVKIQGVLTLNDQYQFVNKSVGITTNFGQINVNNQSQFRNENLGFSASQPGFANLGEININANTSDGRGYDGSAVINYGRMINSGSIHLGPTEGYAFTNSSAGGGSYSDPGFINSLFITASGGQISNLDGAFFRNSHQISMSGTAKLYNNGNFQNLGEISAVDSAFVHNDTSGVLINNGTMSGSIINDGLLKGVGTFGDVSGSGTFSFGLSPGVVTATSFSPSSGAMLNVELEGADGCFENGSCASAPTTNTDYDQLLISGALDLSGNETLNLLFGYTPASGETFDIYAYNSFSGGVFDTISSIYGVTVDYAYAGLGVPAGYSNTVRVTVNTVAVPEPGTYLTLGSFLLAAFLLKKKRLVVNHAA